VRFVKGTFNAAMTRVTLAIDIDENPATGSPGVDSGCQNDRATMGMDYVVTTGGAVNGSNVIVFTYTNQAAQGQSCNTFPGTPENVGTTTFDADGVDFAVPLSALGNDTGRLKFKVLSTTSLPNTCPTCSTSVQDYMTDVDSAPGQVPQIIIF
jgi:hypothetical protein